MSNRDSLAHLCRLLNERIGTLVIPPGRRGQLAVSCFAIALDHQQAIAVLLGVGLNASAAVLLRPMFEATVKGAWLAHSASEPALERHARGHEVPSISTLLSELLQSPLPHLQATLLSEFKRGGWEALSSYTHAGIAQVQRWASASGVEPQYTEVELEEIANIASVMGLLSTVEIARLAGNQPVVAELQPLLMEAGYGEI